MANNTIQVKRSSTAGRQPNTTNSTNSQYINAGELALNMTDQILYTSDGTNLITVGANTVNHNVTGNLTVKAIVANNSLGTANQVLTTNGTGVYWSTVSGGGGGSALPARQLYTANGSVNTFTVTGGYYANNLDVYLNGVKLVNGTDVNTASGSTFTILGSNPPNNAVIEVVGTSALTTTGVSTVVNQQITANGSANSFAITNGYIANSIAVFLNGVKQIPGVDVITTSGSNVNFVSTPANNDVIDVYGYQTAVSYVANTIVVGNTAIGLNSITVGSTSTNVSINSTSISGNLSLNGLITHTYTGAADASIVFSGHNDKGGGGAGNYYNDFLRVAAGNGSYGMWFRTNYTGDLQLINSAYTASPLMVTQGGILVIGGGSAASSNTQNDATANYLQLNNNGSQIYDDGNFHIHSRAANQPMWLNTNGGQIIIGNQAIAGGSVASGIVMGSSTTQKAYLSVYGYKTYSIGSYGYLATGGTGTGSSTTANFGIYSDNRIQAVEFDATSDERAKNIQGTIPLETAIKFVKNIDGIHYTWNTDAVEHNDQGLKAGFGAQSVHKAGFDHMIGVISNDKMEKKVDDDGWVHPEGFQFTMGYNQAIPYHHEVIKNLLERIETLEAKIVELQSNK